LKKLGACSDVIQWARRYRTPQSAWNGCRRGDWMLWWAGKLSGPPGSDSRRKLTLVAALCAETALPTIQDDESLALCMDGIQTCFAYAHGDATLDDVAEAEASCYGVSISCSAVARAALAATSDHGSFAHDAAAYAAEANNYAAWAKRSRQVTGASYDSVVAAARAAQRKTLLRCADIVRANYPEAPVP
jgi:hypothetical protein